MVQKWYKKAVVQAALVGAAVTGVFGVVVALISYSEPRTSPGGGTPISGKATVPLSPASTRELEISPQADADWQAVPQEATRSEVGLRVAGAILSPTPDHTVTGTGVVRAVVYLPAVYAAVLIRPVLGRSFWVQNDGINATPCTELSLPVAFGGRDSYEIYLGITRDPDLFEVDDVLDRRPMQDTDGHLVHWVGPVMVHHE